MFYYNRSIETDLWSTNTVLLSDLCSAIQLMITTNDKYSVGHDY